MIKRIWKNFIAWLKIIVDIDIVAYYYKEDGNSYMISKQLRELDSRREAENKLSKGFIRGAGYNFDSRLNMLNGIISNTQIEDLLLVNDGDIGKSLSSYVNLVIEHTNPFYIIDTSFVNNILTITLDTPIDPALFNIVLEKIYMRTVDIIISYNMVYDDIKERIVFSIDVSGYSNPLRLLKEFIFISNKVLFEQANSLVSFKGIKEEKVLNYFNKFNDEELINSIKGKLNKFNEFIPEYDLELILSIIESNTILTSTILIYRED